MDYLSKFSASAFSVGWVLDTGSTAVALFFGCREANPAWMPLKLGPLLFFVYIGIIITAWLCAWAIDGLLVRWDLPEWVAVPIYGVFIFLGLVHLAASIGNIRTMWMSGLCGGGR